jgi:HD superfamily phosphohydrolase YqeK
VIHPALAAAASGKLPEWAMLSPARKGHARRVADLMEHWARAFDLCAVDVDRWRAAGFLHDALRDADPARLHPLADPGLRELAPDLVHGPAAAQRLRKLGVRDEPVLLAITWHTLGHPDLDRLGRALYLADHLEPGRPSESPTSALRRERVTRDMDGVLRELAAERICRWVRSGRALLEPTVRFWNVLAHD